MSALKNIILKCKSFFKYFLIGYLALDVLELITYIVYMIVYNAKYKSEYNYNYNIYSASSAITYFISSIVGIALLVLLIYLVIKEKQKEAKFVFTGWFIYLLFTRLYSAFDGINTMIWGDILAGIFSLFITLSLLFAMGAIMLEVFNGNKKFSALSPLFFVIALGISLITMIISIISLIANIGDSLIFPFYQIPSLFMGPIFIIIIALTAYTYVTPEDASDDSPKEESTESNEDKPQEVEEEAV